jgi:hypothetical protein
MRPKKRFVVLAALVGAIAALTTVASAANPHLRNNVRPNPAFFDGGLVLRGTAAYAGLGNFDTLQTLDATANPTATCGNPGTNQTQAPGQNPASVDVTGSTAVPAGDIKNGNVTIATTTSPPPTTVEGAPDCPNSSWTETITDLAFTSATIKVFQDSNENGMFEASELVLTVSCTFSPPTSNGSVPANTYSCTES